MSQGPPANEVVAGATFVLGEDLRDFPKALAKAICAQWPRNRRRQMTDNELFDIVYTAGKASMVKAVWLVREQMVEEAS